MNEPGRTIGGILEDAVAAVAGRRSIPTAEVRAATERHDDQNEETTS